ncbi:DUF4962 domain-containing protein [Halolactibacillus halophilus]|uniref:Heparinase II/III-like C-terminal domain-containing protein n=1 Tax=Halolactibacillus halophilus TaxID=306540 RepID=A0ABQ0VMK1_9BACI|nr:DUF4962 domain-containing protein [Halolactibacillus halophilus]GEM02354.1 hypothetical protein HHA03_18860 [Halolactibacillus halophilus]
MNNYLFLDQDVNQLRKDIYTTKKKFFDRLANQCKRYLKVNLPDEHPKESTTYYGMAIANLSLMYVLTGQKQYLNESKRWMLTVSNYPHWGNAHLVDVDLSAAWILFGLSIGYDWLKDDLTEAESTTIKNKLLLQGKRMYDYKIKTEGQGWSTNYWQNHNWINLNGLATAGYALVEDEPTCQSWIDSAKSNFETVFEGLPEDGSSYEGVVYWRYGAMWLFVYAHLLKEREGYNYFKESEFLRNTFYYRLYQSAPNLAEQIPFGDCHDRYSGHSTAIYYKVAAEYNNEHAQYMGDEVVDKLLYEEAYNSNVKPGILPECFFELIFYNDSVNKKNFDDLPLVKKFDDLGLVVVRNSWEKDALHLSFKCSPPGGAKQWNRLWKLKNEKNYNSFGLSHHHPDNNSFILNAFGEFMAIDEGYNRKPELATHNGILVDGLGYHGDGQKNVYQDYSEDMYGKVTDFSDGDTYVYFAGETAKTYDKQLNMKKAKRHIIYLKSGMFIMVDELLSEDPHKYSWLLHTDTESDIYKESDHQQKVVYNNGKSSMEVLQWSKYRASFEQSEKYVKEIMTTQEPDNYRDILMKRLTYSMDDTQKDALFVSTFCPYQTNQDNPFNITLNEDQHNLILDIEANGEHTQLSIKQDESTNELSIELSHNELNDGNKKRLTR